MKSCATKASRSSPRPPASLWWSAVTAGVVISTSTAARGALHHYLPDAPWRLLVESFGYSFGFLIVVLGRLQLFTENTLTAILPLMTRHTGRVLFLTARLWGIVLTGNLVGALLFALAATYCGIFPPEQIGSFLVIAHQATDHSALEMALLGIPAGFLIAVMVWVLPSAEGEQFAVILSITYFIGVGGFTHVIVGSADSFLLLLAGRPRSPGILGACRAAAARPRLLPPAKKKKKKMRLPGGCSPSEAFTRCIRRRCCGCAPMRTGRPHTGISSRTWRDARSFSRSQPAASFMAAAAFPRAGGRGP